MGTKNKEKNTASDGKQRTKKTQHVMGTKNNTARAGNKEQERKHST